MLHSSDNAPKPQYTPSTQNPAAVKTTTAPIDQATIGRSVVIKGEISGAESLYIDGRIEGTVSFGDHRVTVGRNGVVAANISAREVVIMGKVTGNIECSDRVDIRSEGSLTGDIVSQRISIEDGAMLKGAVQVKSTEVRGDSKALSAAAGKSN
jgi:cytoskeletal protein CcmA (bactofilin family)